MVRVKQKKSAEMNQKEEIAAVRKINEGQLLQLKYLALHK